MLSTVRPWDGNNSRDDSSCHGRALMSDPLKGSVDAVDRDWFFTYAAVRDPEAAWRSWQVWSNRARTSDPWSRYRKLLEIAGGVVRTAVNLYLSQSDWSQLSPPTLWDLDTISSALGVGLPHRPPKPWSPPIVRGTWRIALLCELAGVPSPRFHVEVLRSLVEARQTGNISTAIHALRPNAADFHASLQRMIRLERPDGVIWFRITPDADSLEILNGIPQLRAPIPVVVVHGSMQDYPPPVLGHVFPDQSGLTETVERWARKLHQADAARHEVGVVAVRREDGGATSIRNQRIDSIHAGIRAAELQAYHLEVPDYSAVNADEVLLKCPDALGYVCLSDEIAVAVKCLLTTAGRSDTDNVIGFDQSPLATRYGIPSFNQSLEKIGETTWSLFLDFFRRGNNASWPPFRPVPVPLVLG
jgi:hypothetical protein